MKKIKLNTAKLQLNKEKITELSNEQMSFINGGDYGGGNPTNNDLYFTKIFTSHTKNLCICATGGSNCPSQVQYCSQNPY